MPLLSPSPTRTWRSSSAQRTTPPLPPRHVVDKNVTNHHQDNIEEHDNAIGDLLTEILLHRRARGKHERLLVELRKKQAQFHNPAVGAQPAAT
ncbi:MAG: hypothetical protein ACKPKO_38400, partial [Candidatus Fonsibacter sp.]